MSKKYFEEIKRFINAAKSISKLGLVTCSSGNLSWKIDNDIILITSTGSWMDSLDNEHIAIYDIKNANSINGIKPSVEIEFHAGILRIRKDIKIVLHFQSPYATAAACIEPSFENFNVIPEVPYYIGSIKKVPFYPPGSKDLASAVIDAAKSHNMIIMQNHGLVTMAHDMDLLLKRALFFELACKILFIGKEKIKGLSAREIKDMGI